MCCEVYLRPDVIVDEAARLGEVFQQLVYVDLEVLLQRLLHNLKELLPAQHRRTKVTVTAHETSVAMVMSLVTIQRQLDVQWRLEDM